METITLKRNRRLLNLDTKKKKRTFLILNLLLVLGVISIVSTLLYILLNLTNTDTIIIKCIPSFALGLAFVFFYAIGFNELTKKADRHRPFKILFTEGFRLK
jgi:uncharacterized membrane-anchored protein